MCFWRVFLISKPHVTWDWMILRVAIFKRSHLFKTQHFLGIWLLVFSFAVVIPFRSSSPTKIRPWKKNTPRNLDPTFLGVLAWNFETPKPLPSEWTGWSASIRCLKLQLWNPRGEICGEAEVGKNDPTRWIKKNKNMENLVYHFFRPLWLVLGVKLMEINSNWTVFQEHVLN